MPNVNCLLCGKEFYTKPNWIKLGYGKYCSRECSAKSKRKGKFVNCLICGKKIWRAPRFLKKSKSKNFFCSKAHQLKWRHKIYFGQDHPNWKNGKYVEYKKILLKNGIKPKCKICGFKNKKALLAHHVDHNRSNNKINNLVWLCCNCHHLVHNYGVKI